MIRCLLIADFTIDGLAPFLAASSTEPVLQSQVAPFGNVPQTLLDGNLDAWRQEPEVAVVWTRPQSAVPSFARLLAGEPVDGQELLAEVEAHADRLRAAAQRVSALFVPTWTVPAHERGLGLLNLDVKVGPAYHLLRMNAHLAEAVSAVPQIHVLDAARWLALAGPTACNPKLWYLGKIAFGPDVFRHAAADVKAGIRAVKGLSRKLIVLDLDDTLWGGVVGDVGWENLQLGGHDPRGEAFVAFQRALKALTRRGVVLAIVSKNTEAVALQAIDRHPEMLLRRQDFAGWRINWNDKAQNMIELVSELNLGLESVVFIDDNPAERARVRSALPQVLVPEWPADRLLYEKALAELDCFDVAALSTEDRNRTRSYVAERQRRDLSQSAQSVAEYLASLDLKVTVEPLNAVNLPRAAQLLNKTNQMNLATRRLTDAQLRDWTEAAGRFCRVFRVADRFDDYGLTGIASLEARGDVGFVADFVLSCRVIGRGVEQVLLHVLTECARTLGLKQLLAVYLPTPRNAPCLNFLNEHSGLVRRGDEYVWDLRQSYPVPEHVEICLLPPLAV